MRIFPLGDSALTIEFGNEISLDVNAKAIYLARNLTKLRFAGVIEAVPAYASVTIYFDSSKTNHSTLAKEAKRIAETVERAESVTPDMVQIPMEISAETSPDLYRIAEYSGLAEDEALNLFLSATYRVYMIGFLPGFAYMGEVDERIAVPRLETPRTKVPRGSVGIAGKQTGVYPLESPGGWNIIGQTDLRMFDPAAENPCLLKPGDEVRFVRC